MSLFYGDLVDTCLMTSSFESGVEEFGHDLVGGCCIDKSSGHYEHIGVIVLAGKPRIPWCLLRVMLIPSPLPQMAMPG